MMARTIFAHEERGTWEVQIGKAPVTEHVAGKKHAKRDSRDPGRVGDGSLRRRREARLNLQDLGDESRAVINPAGVGSPARGNHCPRGYPRWNRLERDPAPRSALC